MRKALLDSFLWRGVYFITTLILNICIARIYQASQSGWIYFISNNFYLILLVGGLSLDSSITYFSASNRIASHKLALFSVLWPFIVAAFGLVCTGFLIYFHYITSNYLFLIVAATAYTFGISMTNFFTSLFYSNHNFSTPNIFMSSINILTIVLVVLTTERFAGITKNNFLYIYFIQFVIQGVGLAVLYVVGVREKISFLLPDKKDLAILFRFTIIAFSANFAYYLINRIDYFFVEAWCSSKSLGNYVQVSKMGQLLLIIPSIISSAVYPQAAKGNHKAVESLILRMMGVFVLFYILVLIMAYFFSNSIFTFMFGDTFNEMYIPFIILLPGILFLSLHIIIAAYFGGINNPSFNVINTSIGLLVVVAGDIIFIRNMGIIGASLVSTLGYTTAFIISLFLFLKKTNSSLQDLLGKQVFSLDIFSSFFNNQSSTAK